MTRVWPLVAVVFAAATAWLAWRLIDRPEPVRPAQAPPVTEPAPEKTPPAPGTATTPAPPAIARAISRVLPAAPGAQPDDEPSPTTQDVVLAYFAPRPGENLLAYRTRMLPVAKAVIEPQRARVAGLRTAFDRTAHLDDGQRRALDGAVTEAGDAIKDRLLQGLFSGELSPSMKPTTGVVFTRDLLDLAVQADKRFRATLRPDQAAALDGDRFDVVEYLLFTTRWEDLLGVEEK